MVRRQMISIALADDPMHRVRGMQGPESVSIENALARGSILWRFERHGVMVISRYGRRRNRERIRRQTP